VVAEPQKKKGTELEYKIYVGGWGGQTITIGTHRNGTRSSLP